MEDTERKKFVHLKPDPGAAALSRALRNALKVPLVKVAAALGLNWSTVGNFETSTHNLGEKSQRKLFVFFATEMARKGMPVAEIPEEITLPELRLLLAKALFATQSASVVQQADVLEQAGAATELGVQDFLFRVASVELSKTTARDDSPRVNARILHRLQERLEAGE
jgi:hypothetical protein